jgi:hypothetical protein
MTAQELIDGLNYIADHHGIKLTDLEVNYRYDFDSCTEDVGYLFEDLYDEDTNSVLESVVLVSVNAEDNSDYIN